MELFDLRSAAPSEISAFMQQLGEPAFRGRQIFRQINKNGVNDIEQMSDLPLTLRHKLAQAASLDAVSVVRQQVSAANDTAKLLLEFADGERVEMALMLYKRSSNRNRATCCVSCQSGCAMGCVFCATSQFTKFRNLSAGEIVSQVQAGHSLAREMGFPGVTNVVYMGMGEPLANMSAVRRSIELLNDEQGLQLGSRRITVSTCGLVPQIYNMAEWGMQIGLAVSLHSADEKKRRQLMPVAGKYSLSELMMACDYFRLQTGRRVTCEYALIKGINDSVRDARLLGNLLTDRDILVNIIPANAIKAQGVVAPEAEVCAAFCREAERCGVDIQIRESRGTDIDAACGQLRQRVE